MNHSVDMEPEIPEAASEEQQPAPVSACSFSLFVRSAASLGVTEALNAAFSGTLGEYM